jgi:Actinobacteria/chloroflexi VLRF1 release factor
VTASRSIEVSPDRIGLWLDGFAARHHDLRIGIGPGQVTLEAPDGAGAVLHPAFGPLTPPPEPPVTEPPVTEPLITGPPSTDGHTVLAGRPPTETAALGVPRAGIAPAAAAAVLRADALGVAVVRALLVRRGGFACAVVVDDRVTTSRVGSRHVQGRTAAGGWSQQRFARRRAGQVDVLLDSAIETAARVLLEGPPGAGDALVTGGDRALVERALADPRLGALTRLRRGRHLPVGDPRADLVRDLPWRCRAIRVTLHETD